MKAKDLAGHISATYKTLRLGIAAIAFAFPLLLWVGGQWSANLPLQGSMSAYYHAGGAGGQTGQGAMRDGFVGILVAIGTILFLYQGITRLEDHALNLAGILALGVALIPMAWPAGSGGGFSYHGACAIAFFLCIAYVCIFRASDTLPLIKDEARRLHYGRWYRIIGWAMPASPLAAWAVTGFLQAEGSLTFFIEALGVYVFAAFWLLKSREIAEINATNKAAWRRFRIEPHPLTDAFRPARLTAATDLETDAAGSLSENPQTDRIPPNPPA